jgi:hypothetical protein
VLAFLQESAFAVWVAESDWVYPAVLTAHTVGLSLLVGGSVLFDLRLLGVGSGVPVPALKGLVPIMMAGFLVNAVTGLTLFIAAAIDRGTQPVFHIKLLCIAAAIGIDWRLRQQLPADAPPDVRTRLGLKALAVASLALWAAAIVAGRLVAYL